MTPDHGLARRSLSAVGWNSLAHAAALAVLFVRAVILARVLPVEVFGVYAFAAAITTVSVSGTELGMGAAFLHRAAETEDEESAAAVHFSIRALLVAAWAACIAVVASMVDSQGIRLALLVLVATTVAMQLSETPRLLLVRRVEHRRLALLRVLSAVLGSAVAVGVALRGGGLWALLSVDVVTAALTVLVLFGWRPVWRPRFSWLASTRAYYWRFGRTVFAASLLSRAIGKVDHLWTGALLGATPLGLYSRAITFAGYPRRILAVPVISVAQGTYAALKGDRRRLSQAFFRINFVLVRGGALLAGLIAVVAPELIRVLIGARWLPMVDAFRLLLVLSALDPIQTTVASIFPAVGQPHVVVKVRLLQLGLLLLGLLLLTPQWGIAGVAAAVNLTMLVGLALLLIQVRRFVDYSAQILLVPPAVALTGALLAGWQLTRLGATGWGPAAQLAIVGGGFSATYLGLLLLLEGRRLRWAWAWARDAFGTPMVDETRYSVADAQGD